MRPIRQKQLSVPATTYWVMWLCACQTVTCYLSVSLAFIVRKELDCVKCANSKKKKQDDQPLWVAENLHDPPLTKGSRTDNPPSLCSGPPPPPNPFLPVPNDSNILCKSILHNSVHRVTVSLKFFSPSAAL